MIYHVQEWIEEEDWGIICILNIVLDDRIIERFYFISTGMQFSQECTLLSLPISQKLIIASSGGRGTGEPDDCDYEFDDE